MDSITINQLTSAVFTAATIAGVAIFAYYVTRVKQNPKQAFSFLPNEVQKILWDASKYASEFVELMDKNGAIRKELLTVLHDKGQYKLNLAVDLASKYIESLFPGLDINEDQIKDAIQKYVWENPDLFPSSKSENISGTTTS